MAGELILMAILTIVVPVAAIIGFSSLLGLPAVLLLSGKGIKYLYDKYKKRKDRKKRKARKKTHEKTRKRERVKPESRPEDPLFKDPFIQEILKLHAKVLYWKDGAETPTKLLQGAYEQLIQKFSSNQITDKPEAASRLRGEMLFLEKYKKLAEQYLNSGFNNKELVIFLDTPWKLIDVNVIIDGYDLNNSLKIGCTLRVEILQSQTHLLQQKGEALQKTSQEHAEEIKDLKKDQQRLTGVTEKRAEEIKVMQEQFRQILSGSGKGPLFFAKPPSSTSTHQDLDDSPKNRI